MPALEDALRLGRETLAMERGEASSNAFFPQAVRDLIAALEAETAAAESWRVTAGAEAAAQSQGIEDIIKLQERVTALEGALRRFLSASDPTDGFCPHCNDFEEGGRGDGEDAPHETDCPVAEARALLPEAALEEEGRDASRRS